ncbi:MAG: 2-amino-4-ketopentanoate thiolase [Firmicutes bacterium]|nr:2-amino-4-ketopentanoate thiolase [Bacillota bacterium]
MARRGQWVQIYVKVLDAGQRAPNVPPETQAVPLEMVVKGFLQEDQVGLGEPATVRTLADRILQGVLVAVEPRYGHDFGAPVAELLQVGPRVRRLLAGGENHAC